MIDEPKKEEPQQPQGILPEPQDIKLIITLRPGNKIPIIEGPLKDEPLCLYMLEYARLALIQVNNQPLKIIQPKNGIMDFIRNKTRRF